MEKAFRAGGCSYILSIIFLCIACYFSGIDEANLGLKELVNVIWYLGLSILNFLIGMLFTIIEATRINKK